MKRPGGDLRHRETAAPQVRLFPSYRIELKSVGAGLTLFEEDFPIRNHLPLGISFASSHPQCIDDALYSRSPGRDGSGRGQSKVPLACRRGQPNEGFRIFVISTDRS